MIKMKNKSRILACILAFIMIFTSCYVPESFAKKSVNETNKETSKESNSNLLAKDNWVKKDKSNQKTDIIVKYKNETKRDTAIKKVKTNLKMGKMKQKRNMKRQKISVYEIGADDDLNKVIKELNNDPNIEYAQSNYPLKVEATPTDDKFKYQWGLYNEGQLVKGKAGRTGVDDNVLNAWNLTKGSEDVVIGVLDTGIDISHKDLKSNIYLNSGEIAGNGIDDDNNGYIDDLHGYDFANDDAKVYDGTDTDTHGTYAAGIIAASADNGGIVGVAPKVKILPLKFISGSTGYTSDAIEAIEYAKNMGIKIINCSFGGTDNNQALKDAMEDSGILFVCSAGNRGADTLAKPVYPAAYDINNIISVAAIDSKGIIPSFSSYGADVDVAAPGSYILSTIPGDSYDYYSGTSVSAAMVSGIAALAQSYLPSATVTSIKQRIMDTVVKCTALTGKVASGGRVDAFAVLSGTVQSTDNYVGVGNDDDTLPTEGEGEADTWYTTDEKASNAERFHYGEGGINPASGNYSVTCTDMSIPAPGFKVDISRTYNARNQRQTLLGRGWTFGFEGSITYMEDSVEINLPNGSSHVFHNENGIYVGEGTRASFVKAVNGVDLLTTQDQYKYGFSTTSHKFVYMEDKNGNRLTFTYESDKLSKITDTVGRVYTLTYNDNSLLSKVTDPAGRTVEYTYNTNNLLIKVTDPQNAHLDYAYDNSQYLTTLTDQDGYVFQKLIYSHDLGSAQNKVIQSTDANGATWYYSYDMKNQNSTITNKDNKKWTYWFDASMSTIKMQDPEGKTTNTEYLFQDAKTYYGDVKATIDRNGNRTDYDVDLTTGNVTKITKPDGGITIKKYDEWNNVIEESEGISDSKGSFVTQKRTFFIYDSTGSKLLIKSQPLNGTDDYIDGDVVKFAVTKYDYYTKAEASSVFGCNVVGLLKSETDPEGTVTTYTYTQYGDIKTKILTSPNTVTTMNTTTYIYNNVGQKLSEKTAEGNVTEWNYDKNGLVIRKIQYNVNNNTVKSVNRYMYDAAGHKQFAVNPNQYEADKDIMATGEYTGSVGTRYNYYDNGSLEWVKDADSNVNSYTYDIFGNMLTETKPNRAIYRYEYDCMNRLVKIYFKDNETSEEVLLSVNSYESLDNGNTQTKVTTYADNTNTSTVKTIKDYANREVEVINADGGRTLTKYNPDGTISEKTTANGAITYYTYDALDNISNIWKPVSIVNGRSMYSWTGYTYNKEGKLTEEKKGKNLVALNAITDDTYIKSYIYQQGVLTEESDSDGRRTVYTFDKDNRISMLTKYVTKTETQITEKTYNYQDKPVTVTLKVRKGDIIGYDYVNDNETKDVVQKYEYDLNGNLLILNDRGTVTKYTYDYLDRELTTTKQLQVDGVLKEIITSKTYSWDGKVNSETDARKNTTSYEYDKRGNQIKIIDPHQKITRKYYDRMGRVTNVVAPNNYKTDAALTDMPRTVFINDAMGRLVQQIEVYHKMKLNSTYEWSKEWVFVPIKTNQYDFLGNVTSTTDGMGNVTSIVYNLSGDQETVTDAQSSENGLAFTVKYTYNGLGQKVQEAYPDTNYTYTYDGAGNTLSTAIDGITKSTTEYDLIGNAVSITDGRGNKTLQKWNAFGKLAEVTTPGDTTIPSNRTIYQYDMKGQLRHTKDLAGVITEYEYDLFGRNTGKIVTNSSGDKSISTFTAYDYNGNITSQTDGRGNTTTYNYDELNRKKTETNALNQTTTDTYDDNGNLTEETNYLGNTTYKTYDGINRLVEVRDAGQNIVQQILYNNANAQTITFDALHHETRFTYDKNMRQAGTIAVMNGKEIMTSFVSYDTRGNILLKKDGNNNSTKNSYDGENHLIKVEDAKGNKTTYTYDACGNVLSMKDGSGNVTTYEYNAANKLKKKMDPNGSGKADKTESYTYNANGLMATKTDRNGTVTTYKYDNWGRLISENAVGVLQSYTYDNNGNILTMKDDSGTTTRTYDALNRNNSKTVPGIGTSKYDYDLATGTAGEYKERTTDPKGNVTEKIYDKMGRLSKVTVGDETTQYDYYRNGRQYRVTYPNNTTETYVYDERNQITSLINVRSNGTTISSYQYTYDAAGNQTSKTDGKKVTSYTYDELNRLSSVTEPVTENNTDATKLTSYEYDGAGNRNKEKIQIGDTYTITFYDYNEQNRLMTTINISGEKTRYVYDKNGNLTGKTVGKCSKQTIQELIAADKSNLPKFDLIIRKDTDNGTGTKNLIEYNYDNFNRLTKLKDEDTTASYQYNAEGYRIKKTVNGVTTGYLYEGDKVVLETDKDNNQNAVQVYGNNLLYRSATASNGAGVERYFYLYNAHGDVTSIINPSGSVDATYDYDAFGNIINETGEANNSIMYSGYQHDDESGLYYLNARYYDSVTARFISEDDPKYSMTKDPLSLNLYTYCHNEPIMYTDPSGHWQAFNHGGSSDKVSSNMTEKITKIVGKLQAEKIIEKLKKENTETWATEVCIAYLESEKLKIVVNGDKDSDATIKAQDDWYNAQVPKIGDYVKAIVAGDKYVDAEKNIFHKPGSIYDDFMHGFQNKNSMVYDKELGKDVNKSSFDFYSLSSSNAGKLLTMNNYNKNDKQTYIDNYITKPAKASIISEIFKIGKDPSAMESTIYQIGSASLSSVKDGPEKYFNTQEGAALFVLGMGLHTVQDTSAHIVEIGKHVPNCDIPVMKMDETGKWKKDPSMSRVTQAETDTKAYLSSFLSEYGSSLFTPSPYAQK